MTITSGIAIYLTIWWVTLFTVLPIGIKSHAEAGIEVPGGGDPASPVDPKLKRKFITTTWVAAIFWLILWAVLHFHLITLPDLAEH